MQKKYFSGLQDFLGPNSGTWALIVVHLFILAAIVFLFGDIISRLESF